MGIWSWNRGGSLTRQICLISIIWNPDKQHYIPSAQKKYSEIFSQITLKQHPGLRLCAEHVPDSVYLTNLIFCTQFPFARSSSKIIRITRIWGWYWGTPPSWLAIGTMMPGTKLVDKAQKDKFYKLEMDKGYEANGHLGSHPYSTVFKKHSQLIHLSHVLKRPGMVDWQLVRRRIGAWQLKTRFVSTDWWLLGRKFLLVKKASIYNRKVLFVCLSRKMITLPNGPSRTFRNLLEPSRTFQNLLEPSRTFQNLPEPSRTFRNLPEPSRTF